MSVVNESYICLKFIDLSNIQYVLMFINIFLSILIII